MPKIEYKHLSHHFQFASQEGKMIATPASVERVVHIGTHLQRSNEYHRGERVKCVFNFEIHHFLFFLNGQYTPIVPHLALTLGQEKGTNATHHFFGNNSRVHRLSTKFSDVKFSKENKVL